MIKLLVEKNLAVFFFTFLILLAGLYSYIKLPRENFPEIRRPMIFITTVYPGVSAADIETLVTREIESELDGLEGLDDLSSRSVQGMSQVTAEFTGDSEIEKALRRVKERVDIAKARLPQDAEEPVVRELDFANMPILSLAVTNPDGLEILDPFVDRLEDEFNKVAGVREVAISGKVKKEVLIEVDPSLLKHYGFSLDNIANSINSENITIPGGVLQSQVKDYSLAVSGEIKKPEEFAEIMIKHKGKKTKLKNMAKVAFQYSDEKSVSRVNGDPAISISIKKRSGENIVDMTKEIKSIVDRQKESMPANTKLIYTLDSADDVINMVNDLENNIVTGLLFVILVTLFFLGPINSTFIALGIPFSMLLSFIIISFIGLTLNMVVLFALTLALGMLVDNGIVIVENIYRHRSLGKSRTEAAIAGTQEVALPITSSTLTTVLAFFPIIFMPGIMGEFMSILPKTVIIVLISSLIIALSVITVFCSQFLSYSKKGAEAMAGGGGGFFQVVQNRYTRILERCLEHPWKITLFSLFLVISGIAVQVRFGHEPLFFPKTDPNSANVSLKLPTGTPLSVTDSFSKPLESLLASRDFTSIENVQATIGDTSSVASEANTGTIRVGFEKFALRDEPSRETIYRIDEKISVIPGAEMKVRAREGGPPSGHDISYEVTGDDYEIIGRISEQIEDIIHQEKQSFEDIETNFEAVKPEVSIEVNREKAALYGLNTRLIASTIRTAISGRKVTVFRQGKEEYDVTLRLDRNSRNSLASLNELEIVSEGKRISLAAVAKIEPKSTLARINRRDRRRAISVWADFKANIDEKEKIKTDIESKVSKIQLPTNYRIGQGKGQNVRNESTIFLIEALIIAIMMIFMVLVLQFNSFVQSMIILFSVFLSLGGVFWGLFLSGQDFVVIMSGIGVISLAGVVVNNAIVLIDFINQLILKGLNAKEAVLEAGRTRLRPVLLTAITTIIGLLPMGFGVSLDLHNFSIKWSSESSNFWAPMAWTVIYGLSFATVLTLILVPVLVFSNQQFKTNWLRRKNAG